MATRLATPDSAPSTITADYLDWLTRELASHDALFAKLGAKRPAALAEQRARLEAQLQR